jgi:hypothetical protein
VLLARRGRAGAARGDGCLLSFTDMGSPLFGCLPA